MPPSPETFIARWNGISGSERSNYQLFIIELCELLDLPRPEPAGQTHGDNSYVFERHLKEHDPDAKASNRFIDCYRRACFVLEAKSVQINRASQGAKIALRGAHGQALNYVRNLPAQESRPPFLIVVDVGDVIELYSEFSRSGGAYLPFPDPGSHRIRIADLADPAIRERLRQVWLDPMALDPTRISARVTRAISADLAVLAKSLEQAGHDTHAVAGFLTRSLFTLFAEDVALLPRHDGKGSFTALLETLADTPEQFEGMVGELWQKMDSGGFSVALRAKLLRFNGKFFKDPVVLPLTRAQIALLLKAAHADWTLVEPAIFGTLLERALDPTERHSLGAHYTPRAYVERLVLPTVMEPLRADWANVQAAALLLDREGRHQEAQQAVRAFHYRLCSARVLDPACGSGNFLYVTMEHMKRLEGEVLDLLQDLGASGSLDAEGLTVDPHQFLGLELNPRAAAIAEMVLWIGHLQWHFRTRGASLPPEPVLRDFHNIECRDAVLDWDARTPALDEAGQAISRWDGVSRKPHPVTGELVPDETARVALWRYANPRPASWPEAEFIVGNPPFIGTARMRDALGDGYTEALRRAWPEVPESADLVMYWWQHAADQVRQGRAQQFGLITTNSLRQTFNRRVVQTALDGGLALAFAIPDHPWVENSDGAAVRIAMTVGAANSEPGRLVMVSDEKDGGGEGLEVTLNEQRGLLHADLRIGANVAGAVALRATERVANRGVQMLAFGFVVTPQESSSFQAELLLRPYRNGRDFTDQPRGVLAIDTYGLAEAELRQHYPAVWQWLHDRAKPERDNNPRASYRENWWLFGENQPAMRASVVGLRRYIATPVTAKHRIFQFLDAEILPDQALVCIALEDAYFLGVLSSSVHVVWALAAGGRLGVGNDPRYNKTRCFETFPFPDFPPPQPSPASGRGGNGEGRLDLPARIRDLAEQLDAHRKRQQAAHPELTLTGMYNVLEKLRSGETLNAKDKLIHEAGLVSVLLSLHDELDQAVLQAYGWSDLLPCRSGFIPTSHDTAVGMNPDLRETILERLVALNAERAREEAQGKVRWLRPALQNPQAAPQQQILDATREDAEVAPVAAIRKKIPWPAELPAQMAAIAQVLSSASGPLSLDQLAEHFSGKGAWKKRLPQLVETLVALGRAEQNVDGISSHVGWVSGFIA